MVLQICPNLHDAEEQVQVWWLSFLTLSINHIIKKWDKPLQQEMYKFLPTAPFQISSQFQTAVMSFNPFNP